MLLPIDVTGGMLCSLLDDGVNAGIDRDIEVGGGVEVLMSGNSGEDGVTRGTSADGCGVTYVGRLIASAGYPGLLRLSGTGICTASAIAVVNDDALGKRAAGSLARQRIMTMLNAAGILGLTRVGGSGVALRCSAITAVGLSAWKGGTPVTSSYRITPRE